MLRYVYTVDVQHVCPLSIFLRIQLLNFFLAIFNSPVHSSAIHSIKFVELARLPGEKKTYMFYLFITLSIFNDHLYQMISLNHYRYKIKFNQSVFSKNQG